MPLHPSEMLDLSGVVDFPPTRVLFRHALETFTRSLEAICFPGGCFLCGQHSPVVPCAECLSACLAPLGPTCSLCGESWRIAEESGCLRCRRFGRPFAFHQGAALWRYEGPVRQIVHAFKYHGHRELLASLGRRMADCARLQLYSLENGHPVVLAVPCGAEGYRRRGYDPSVELASAWAQRKSLRFIRRGLVRRKETMSQSQVSGPRRWRRQAGVFRAKRWAVEGESVLLVDDVLSTGATADACARALRLAGARETRVVALAT